MAELIAGRYGEYDESRISIKIFPIYIDNKFPIKLI